MILKWLKSFLEKIDDYRDRLLFPFIKRFWPRAIKPNHLTILRIILAISLFIGLFLGLKNRIVIVAVFFLAIILDLFDGSVARALNKKTKIGAYLDPLADKILIIPIIIFILYKNYFWLLVLLLLPEIIAVVNLAYHKSKSRIVRVNIFGKTKMVFESLAFVIILFNYPSSPHFFPIILLYFGVVFSFLSVLLNFIHSPKND